MKLLLYIVILGIAVWCGLLLRQDSGYVLLAYQQQSIEMPLWLALIFLLVGVVLLLMTHRFFLGIVNKYNVSKDRLRRFKIQLAHQHTIHSLLALVEARWIEAEKNATKGFLYSEVPFINYLFAAKAAHEQQAWDRRDSYIQLAFNYSKRAKIAVFLTQAQLQFKQGQLEKSLITLCELRKIVPQHPLVIKLLALLHQKSGNLDQAIELLSMIKKMKWQLDSELKQLEIKVYRALLLKIKKEVGIQAVFNLWRSIPKLVREYSAVVEGYVICLCRVEAYQEAECILRMTLQKHWDKRLVRAYGLLPKVDLSKQVSTAESWLKGRENDPHLLLTLARLCLQQQLWGKARNYFEASLQLEEMAETYAELGRLLNHLGEFEKSQDCYKKGLLIMVDIFNLWDKNDSVA